MTKDPELLAHQQWLGYLQPVGLVVSPPALLQAQCHVNVNVAEEQQRFLSHLGEKLVVGNGELLRVIKDLRALLLDVFGWQAGDLIAASDPRAAGLEVVLPEYHETLRPTYAVFEDPKVQPPSWMMLIQELPAGTPLDEVGERDEQRWKATPKARFERLLRETQVPIGLLCNGTALRLVYYPRGESAGHVTFPIAAMTEVAGRPIFAALLMLLSAERLFTLPDKQRLPAVLAESRKYQSTVSTELAQQVLAALYELLRGFQAADDLRKGELLREVLQRDPDQVYAGLLTVLLRLVFLLYAEDRGLMSDDEVYVKHYSVTGLFERLRADAGRYPDTMDLRYGAWAQLLTLFRLVHDGGRHGKLRLPSRQGYLFNPDRYPFLEGRPHGAQRQPGGRVTAPLVSDGVIFRVLHNLLVLDGERISYRSLDVEQIGSVYETMMGFRLEKAAGRSIAIKPKKTHGAPVTINLEELLKVPAKDRAKWLKDRTDQTAEGKAATALRDAKTPEDLVAALDRRVARALTPNIVPGGSMALQPSDERRRSGSHYTPRSLTEPIVRKALEPVLKQLGERPRPEQILALTVCDPAMGSGAFLVEACRQLGDALVTAWHGHACLPTIPPAEDEILHARRVVAQRGLYGVDKNPMAVDLAKLSLWLATLAKDHPFTFLDHALRNGDSLVGLSREQITEFHWKDCPQRVFGQEIIEERIKAATKVRQEILEAGDEVPFLLKQQKLALADESLELVRFAGNLVVAAFFAEDNDRKRQLKRDELLGALSDYLKGTVSARPTAAEKDLREGEKGITPFHWEIEYPEVFGRDNPGFDCTVGNPPFLGGTRISTMYGKRYLDYLYAAYEGSGNRMDLVAYFFRRTFGLLRVGGTMGMIATNTIAQGDTREGGLRWICTREGHVYSALRRYKWPGEAAVVVCVPHIIKSHSPQRFELDGKSVPRITAFLFHAGGHEAPIALKVNAGRAGTGSKIYGQGFLFADDDPEASTIAEMQQLIATNPRCRARIFPYIGGEEINESPTHEHHRYVIDFGEMDLKRAREWPELLNLIEKKVKPFRDRASAEVQRCPWWQHFRSRADLYAAMKGLDRVLACSQTSKYLAFTFMPSAIVFSHKTVVLLFSTASSLCVVQSRVHLEWADFFGSSLEDRPVYTPSDCFETFPFPKGFESNAALQAAGQAYYELRANLMVRNNEGLTKTYNRFHDPNEKSPDILKLRELHAAMDRAVFDAYGGELAKLTVPPCEFLLDYEDQD
jgi:hypothetical protein